MRLRLRWPKIKWPKIDFTPVVRWAGRWILPIFFYGFGLGMMFPIMNRWIGWDVYQAGGGEETTQWFEATETRCLTELGEGGVPTAEICITENIDTGYTIGESGFADVSDFIIPVRLIVGIIILFIAYRLTPKP